MKLTSLQLWNFRQFYGHQKIVFSTSSKEKITFIHAENSAGKTTILNAILWCMFGKDYCSENFANPDILVNNTAFRDGTVSCKVAVGFVTDFPNEDGVTEYIMQRSYNQKTKEEKIALQFKDPKEQSWDIYKDQNQKDLIQQMMQRLIPPKMLKHFFTAGEAAEKTGINNSAFKESFETLLGMHYIERAQKDLQFCKNDFYVQSQKGQKNEKRYQELRNKEKSLREDEDKLSEKTRSATDQIKDCDKRISEAEDIIRQNDGPNKIAEDRKNKEFEKSRKKKEYDENEKSIKNWISRDAVSLLFSPEQLHSINQYVNDAKSDRIAIEYPINKKLLDLLLNRKVCICGTKITEKEEKKLKEALEQIIQDPKEEEKEFKSAKLKNFVVTLTDKAEVAEERIEILRKKRVHLRNEMSLIQKQIEVLDEQLSKNQIKDVSDAEKIRREARTQRDILFSKKAEYKEEKKEIARKLSKLESDLNALHTFNYSKEEACACICEKLIRKCDRVLSEEIPNAREIVVEKMNHFLAQIGNKVRVLFNAENDMYVTDALGNPFSPGGAEASFIALSFVLAMTEISKERAYKNQESGNNFLPGLIAPFIFDSVMGVFDETNRSIFWEYIPQKSDQMILLLSSTQGGEDIAKKLRENNLVGKEYYLKAHGDNVTHEKEIKCFIKGQIRDLKISDTHIFTEIKEI